MNDFDIDYLGNHIEFANEVAELWTREWSSNYSKEKVANWAKLNASHFSTQEPPFIILAYKDDTLLGTSALLLNELKSRPEYDIWIGGVFVKPQYRNKGLATNLIEAAYAKAVQLGYEKIYLKTENTQSLYEKLGWTHLEKTQNDDNTPTDSFIKIYPNIFVFYKLIYN